jgi:hypothetical protein
MRWSIKDRFLAYDTNNQNIPIKINKITDPFFYAGCSFFIIIYCNKYSKTVISGSQELFSQKDVIISLRLGRTNEP